MLRGVLVLVFASLLSTSCSDIVSSVSLALPTDTEEMAVYLLPAHLSDMQSRSAPLKALNKNAQKGSIRNPKESDAMYFAFEKSPAIRGLTDSGLYALELEFEPLELTGKSSGAESINTDAIQTDAAELTVGLLYANDFSVSGTLKHSADTAPPRFYRQHRLCRRNGTGGAYPRLYGFGSYCSKTEKGRYCSRSVWLAQGRSGAMVRHNRRRGCYPVRIMGEIQRTFA